MPALLSGVKKGWESSQEKQRAYDRDERGQRDEHRVRRSSEAAPENRTELGQPLFAWAATAKIIGNFRSF